ncbi:DoxX-like family protein [Sphingomonas jatrophae]|uniref:DoxX-like family protein n=2 Tax=Sphingomonas jatrophae TaxID=1166337 RepID=A0A1I6LHZ1_9SPHN|nr:DoxX-like family protein [Sphingomonas jatrophae]
MTAQPAARLSRGVIAGRVLSGIAILFLAMDAGGKLIAPAAMIANSPPLGLPAEIGFYRLLGLILAACTLLYTWPRTAVLGAVLLTGYLGGAIACHLRVGNPLVSHTLFGLYLGAIVWGGLLLRRPALRAVFMGDAR